MQKICDLSCIVILYCLKSVVRRMKSELSLLSLRYRTKLGCLKRQPLGLATPPISFCPEDFAQKPAELSSKNELMFFTSIAIISSGYKRLLQISPTCAKYSILQGSYSNPDKSV